MKTVTVKNEGRYNFHNVRDLTLRVANPITRNGEVVAMELTRSQYRKVNKHFCGMSDCCCGSEPKGYEEIDHGKAVIHFDNDRGY